MNLVANTVARLRGVFRRAREDAETREELEFHLQMETEKNLRAGMTPIEARRQAHVRLGGVEAIREAVRDARGTRLVEDLLRDLGYACRVARRSPGFTAVVVVSLAIPIGFTGAIVGVSADYRVRFPTEEPAPYLHFAASQRARADAVLLARTDGDAAALAADIRRELRRREPDVFFYLQGDTLREKADVTMLPYRVGASVASASGVVAMALGAVGLYGVVAFLVAIRSALGARPAALLGLVLAAGGRVVVLGVAVGAVLALAAARVVAGATGGVAASDPVVWAGAVLLVAGVAAAAHVGPARRVVRLDLKRALQVD